MKKILLLLLVSSPIFSMQPKHINEIKQEQLKSARLSYTQMALAYTTAPSTIMTLIPTPLTVPYVVGNIAIIGAAMTADKITAHYMQEKNNNK